jgi:hypothetical protein
MTANQITTALGYTPVSSSSQAIARAWVNFDGTRDTSGAVSSSNTNRLIRTQVNVSSVLRNSAGDYTVNFAIAMADANYCAVVSCGGPGTSFVATSMNTTGAGTEVAPTASACRFITGYDTGPYSFAELKYNYFVAFR